MSYTKLGLLVNSFQCVVERFKRKTKSYFLDPGAREGGKENGICGGMSFCPLEIDNYHVLIEHMW